jgi:ubiquinone/menaquinone biosynthesis C-methylase UbiE
MNADPIARLYRFLEYATFGPLLWRTRIHFIEHLKTSKRILILGEGDGRFLAHLLTCNPSAQIDCYDLSAQMLDLAKARTKPHHHRIHFHHQDITQSSLPANTYDAIVANFFVDCFDNQQLTALLEKLQPATQPNCLWLVSDFAIPDRPIPRIAAQLLTRFLFLCFRLTTGLKTRRLPDYESALTQIGLKLQHKHNNTAGILTSQLWSTDHHSTAA